MLSPSSSILSLWYLKSRRSETWFHRQMYTFSWVLHLHDIEENMLLYKASFNLVRVHVHTLTKMSAIHCDVLYNWSMLLLLFLLLYVSDVYTITEIDQQLPEIVWTRIDFHIPNCQYVKCSWFVVMDTRKLIPLRKCLYTTPLKNTSFF